MKEILVVATGGAGGDLPPLVAASLALRERGYETTFIGDASVQRTLAPLQVDVEVLPTEVDLGPRLARVVQEAMQASGGDLAKAGPLLQRGMTVWAHHVAEPISRSIERHRPTAIVTSLFAGSWLAHVPREQLLADEGSPAWRWPWRTARGPAPEPTDP